MPGKVNPPGRLSLIKKAIAEGALLIISQDAVLMAIKNIHEAGRANGQRHGKLNFFTQIIFLDNATIVVEVNNLAITRCQGRNLIIPHDKIGQPGITITTAETLIHIQVSVEAQDISAGTIQNI